MQDFDERQAMAHKHPATIHLKVTGLYAPACQAVHEVGWWQ